MKQLSLSELRRIAERTRVVRVPVNWVQGSGFRIQDSTPDHQPPAFTECIERIPWKVWYVSASNGDVIRGEEVITLAVYVDGPGAYPSRLVQFTASGQTRRLRDCCILRANDFMMII